MAFVVMDREVTIKVDFLVLKKIEERVDLIKFLEQMKAGRPSYTSLGWIIYSAVGSKLKESEYAIGNWCMNYFEEASGYATDIILHILKPAPEIKKKDEAEATEVKEKIL